MIKVDAFIPCFVDQFYPETARNFIELIKRAGCEVNYNPDQTCCGQPAFNSGYWKEARTVAGTFLDVFNNADYIVSPSASCTGFVRNYYERLFEGDTARLEQFQSIRNSIYELTDFLVNRLEVVQLGAVFNQRVTYHDSCAGLREYGIKKEPRLLLEHVEGLELVEMEHTDTCCGFGGTFAAKFHHISTAMTEQKVEHAMNTGADYIVSTDSSCLMNIEAYIKKKKLPLRTIHLADLLCSR